MVAGGSGDVLFFDAAGTRLNVGLESRADTVVGRGLLELDFLGAGAGPFSLRIRPAYAELQTELGSIRMGPLWTLIGQHFPTSFNLDGIFLQGTLHNRLPQVATVDAPEDRVEGVSVPRSRNLTLDATASYLRSRAGRGRCHAAVARR